MYASLSFSEGVPVVSVSSLFDDMGRVRMLICCCNHFEAWMLWNGMAVGIQDPSMAVGIQDPSLGF